MLGKTMIIGNVTLKAYTLEEITAAQTLVAMSDHEVTQFTLQGSAATKEGEAKWYEHAVEDKGDVHWGIYVNNKFRGFTSLHLRHPGHCYEAGMIIFDKKMWSKGVGTKALIGILWYAVMHLNARMVTAGALSPNKASVALQQKLGFTIVGTQYAYDYRNGSYADRLYLQWITPGCEKVLFPDGKIPQRFKSAWPKAEAALKRGKRLVKYAKRRKHG